MPGGPVDMSGGIGANAPKSKIAGILMVGVIASYSSLRILHLHKRPVLPHLEESSTDMILVPSLVSSRCRTGLKLLATVFLSHRPSPTAMASLPLKGPSSYPFFPPVPSLVSDIFSPFFHLVHSLILFI